MRKQIASTLLALAGFLPANAQYTFTLNVSWSGNCSGYTAQMNQAIRGFQTQTINGFPTRELCEQTRAMCHQELGHIELIYFDVKTGKEIKREATNCKLNVSTTPCTGRPMAGSVGTLNALGVSQGTSFYSSNTADEIQNWSNDDMERMLVLNKDLQSFKPTNVATGDPTFDIARNKLSGRMPDGSTSYIISDNQTSSIDRPSHSGILVPDDFTNRPFDYGLGEYSSPDLSSVNINLDPVEPYSSSEISSKNTFMDAISSIDERLDWYNAINRGEENVFQYMYTRWGKENVMAGVDWWERNHIGDRISNAFATVKETIVNTIDHPMDAYDNVRNATIGIMKENIDDGIKSTVQFMLPPQYQNSGERVQAIYDAEKGTITDVLGIIKKAPDMISKGETFDTDAILSKERDRYMGLAASYGSPTTSKAYEHLKSASDIYNMPKEQQRKGLAKWLGKEAKKEAKKEFENSRYSEKWNSIKKKAKSIIDPYNIIDD